MATLYASAVSPTGDNARQSTRSYAHARSRTTLSTYDGAPTTADELVFAIVKSDNMIEDVQFWTDGAATAGAMNVGFWELDMSNQGFALTDIDQDLFASAQSLTTGRTYQNRWSLFAESTTLDDVLDRGKSAWQLAAIGAASYTEDPGKLFAIVGKPTTTADADTKVAVKIKYVAGD